MATTETLIASKLRKAGMDTNEYILRQIAADCLKKTHGNVQRALPHFAKQLAEADLALLAFALAPVLQRYATEMSGQVISDNRLSPAARADGGPAPVDGHPANASVREPSPAQRAATAAVAAKISVLDTYRVRDGRAIGDVRYGEIEHLRNQDAMAASIWRQIQRAHPNAPHDMAIRDVLKAEELQRMIQRAAEVADAA